MNERTIAGTAHIESVFGLKTDKVGLFFKKLSSGSPRNSEVYSDKNGEIKVTGNRLHQFLRGAEEVAIPYMDEKGRVDILCLAQEYGYTVTACDDMRSEIEKLACKPGYADELKDVPKDNAHIDGFSLTEEKKIIINSGIDMAKRNFVIAHELAHHFLNHSGEIFFRTPDDYEKKHEHPAYHAEANKLAAILLLPHSVMQHLLDHPDSELADRFEVPEKTLVKRKEEVEWEINELGFVPRPLLE